MSQNDDALGSELIGGLGEKRLSDSWWCYQCGCGNSRHAKFCRYCGDDSDESTRVREEHRKRNA